MLLLLLLSWNIICADKSARFDFYKKILYNIMGEYNNKGSHRASHSSFSQDFFRERTFTYLVCFLLDRAYKNNAQLRTKMEAEKAVFRKICNK